MYMISGSLIVSVLWTMKVWNDNLHVCIDSMVQGYHEYQSIWDNPLANEDLPCEWEMGNSHNSRAVAIRKLTDAKVINALQGTCQRKYLQFVWYS